MKRLVHLLRDERGSTAIEYGVLVALLGLATVGGATLLADDLETALAEVSDCMQADGFTNRC